ncbi:MAG: gliding motility-associated ABC transporter ATP-binding subunit GldA [Saprospiraceae bacterium]|nr:gliding motility-associated ABC transporter ATP-binding subunit GldA [Saprospiraceae bacterium]MBP7680154.1 gliding motility-associated ABC transporter ATP-binding subunit GldA [Saprospiraceae bacterium]
MSVIIQNLTKIYGTQRAVNNISFEAHKGNIVGFLGPNGAGKTTTMKMITCYLPPTSGMVKVCGFDTTTHDIEVRRRVGYLPEHNPLYKEMYIKEYLHFVAHLYQLPNVTKRVSEMIEITGLGREQHKQIGELSKGYRQRVGLAQAMIHNPEVLILDEPTSGLDPNQLVDIRQLIKDLGKEKTVIFSTHIMQEVQALCDSVVIINKGEIVANDAINNLAQHIQSGQVIVATFAESVNITDLQKIKYVREVQHLGNNRFQLICDGDQEANQEVFKFAVDNKLTLLEIHKEAYSVADVFRKLTK